MMDGHSDNFDSFNPYPYSPGHRGVETSIEAAEELAPSLGRMQRMVQHAIAQAGLDGLTGDEIAEATGINKYTVRARTAELRASKIIGDSGKRRLNCTGRKAIVWVLHEHLPEVGQ